jgi:hypothetical protein
MQVTAPPADVWIEQIQRSLPSENEPRSRNILLRVLLLLLQVRNLPDFELLPIKVFAALQGSIVWPSSRARFDLGPIVGCFFTLDDLTVAAIREHLQTLLNNAAPKPSLKEHFAKAFSISCADTDHIAKVGSNPAAIMTMLAITLENSINVLEDFTAKTPVPLTDTKIREAIRAFYAAQGYIVSFINGDGFADKDEHLLAIKYSNHSSGTDGNIMVTVRG